MANRMFVGVNGTARKVSNLYVGVDGVARRVKRAYVGVNDVAQLCYINEATSVTIYAGASESIQYTYNNATRTVTTNSAGIASVDIQMTETEANITFTSLTTGFTRTETIVAGSSSNNVYVRPTNIYFWNGVDGSRQMTTKQSKEGSSDHAYIHRSNDVVRMEIDGWQPARVACLASSSHTSGTYRVYVLCKAISYYGEYYPRLSFGGQRYTSDWEDISQCLDSKGYYAHDISTVEKQLFSWLLTYPNAVYEELMLYNDSYSSGVSAYIDIYGWGYDKL